LHLNFKKIIMKTKFHFSYYLIALFFTVVTNAQTARMQIIHNSSDNVAKFVDIYINNVLRFPDLEFRHATPFFDVDGSISITVVAGSSMSATENVYSISNLTTNVGRKYIYVIDGVRNSSVVGYVPGGGNFGFQTISTGRETALVATNTDVLVHHGSFDAPIVDINDVTTLPFSNLVNDIAYKSFSNYLSLPTSNYTIDVRNSAGTTVVKTYSAPLATLGLEGKAITVVASGFFTPANSSFGPSFGLWAATSAGGKLVELPEVVLSTNEFESKNVTILPNPANDNLNINFKDFNDTRLVLTDVQGRNVLETKLYSESTTVNVSDLEKGMYIATLLNSNNTGRKSVKVLVK
jgi:hypothetical protein